MSYEDVLVEVRDAQTGDHRVNVLDRELGGQCRGEPATHHAHCDGLGPGQLLQLRHVPTGLDECVAQPAVCSVTDRDQVVGEDHRSDQ